MMKKILLATLFALVTFGAQAQIEFGIQFSPTISTTRINSTTDAFEYSKNGAGVQFNAGPVVDIFFKDNLAVSTGLWYAVKRTGVKVADTTSGVASFGSVANTQYLQVPITLKFYTQEIIAGTRLNITLGGTTDIKIAQDNIEIDDVEFNNENTYSKFFDVSLLIGVGGEMKLGSRNKVFAQIFYSRGLVNMLTKKFDDTEAEVNGLDSDNLKLNSDQLGLMIGYKF